MSTTPSKFIKFRGATYRLAVVGTWELEEKWQELQGLVNRTDPIRFSGGLPDLLRPTVAKELAIIESGLDTARSKIYAVKAAYETVQRKLAEWDKQHTIDPELSSTISDAARSAPVTRKIGEYINFVLDHNLPLHKYPALFTSKPMLPGEVSPLATLTDLTMREVPKATLDQHGYDAVRSGVDKYLKLYAIGWILSEVHERLSERRDLEAHEDYD